jgi:hypothetical protein
MLLAGLGLVALLGSHAGVFWLGGEHTRRVVAEGEAQRAQNAIQAVLEAQQEAAEADIALKKKLAIPKSLPKVQQVLNETPPDCELPSPVADSLRDEIARRNKLLQAP